ncbi:helix-turn-helix domain-containing protein [Taibaiella koreensis]|uniref:helix-turn-helix domain-containing protein n=1 Tax=Taibaiella koreensis TaxID=1268548 RepID=UPI000E59DF1E|nr:helix-turn-helix domain-containing protein [Taibaiella koreensis]
MLVRAETEIPDSFSIRILPFEGMQQAYRLRYHRILFLTGGGGMLQIDDNTFFVSGSSLFLISKGQIFIGNPALRMEGYEIAFGDCFWERTPSSVHNCKAALFDNATGNRHLLLNDEDRAGLEPHIVALHEEAAAGPYINKLDVLAAFLKIIMIKIANIDAALTGSYDNHERQLYHRFLQLTTRQYEGMHEVAGYAAQLHITARRLSDICRRFGGKSAKQVINDQVLAEAKRQLQFSSLAVKEIAYKLHFTTPEQFNRFFRKHTQSSPSAYRSGSVNLDR